MADKTMIEIFAIFAGCYLVIVDIGLEMVACDTPEELAEAICKAIEGAIKQGASESDK